MKCVQNIFIGIKGYFEISMSEIMRVNCTDVAQRQLNEQ